MKKTRIGTFIVNTVRMVLLVFYALVLTIIIGGIQLCVFAVTQLMKKRKTPPAAGKHTSLPKSEAV